MPRNHSRRVVFSLSPFSSFLKQFHAFTGIRVVDVLVDATHSIQFPAFMPIAWSSLYLPQPKRRSPGSYSDPWTPPPRCTVSSRRPGYPQSTARERSAHFACAGRLPPNIDFVTTCSPPVTLAVTGLVVPPFSHSSTLSPGLWVFANYILRFLFASSHPLMG